MTRKQLTKMYSELDMWIKEYPGIEFDILNEEMRPEYKTFVNEARACGTPEQDIPQQVLWNIRGVLKRLPKEKPFILVRPFIAIKEYVVSFL